MLEICILLNFLITFAFKKTYCPNWKIYDMVLLLHITQAIYFKYVEETSRKWLINGWHLFNSIYYLNGIFFNKIWLPYSTPLALISTKTHIGIVFDRVFNRFTRYRPLTLSLIPPLKNWVNAKNKCNDDTNFAEIIQDPLPLALTQVGLKQLFVLLIVN